MNNNQDEMESSFKEADSALPTSTEKPEEKNVGVDEQESSRPREQTRSKVALLFVLGFFAILFLCFAYGVKTNASLSELKDVLIGIIGALSGTLGFIIGFYYKSIKEQ